MLRRVGANCAPRLRPIWIDRVAPWLHELNIRFERWRRCALRQRQKLERSGRTRMPLSAKSNWAVSGKRNDVTKRFPRAIIVRDISASTTVTFWRARKRRALQASVAAQKRSGASARNDVELVKARELLDQSKLDEAESAVRANGAKHPRNSEGYFLLGLTLFAAYSPRPDRVGTFLAPGEVPSTALDPKNVTRQSAPSLEAYTEGENMESRRQRI